jgi:hypothetical protein
MADTRRKHRFQMSDQEIARIERHVHAIPSWSNVEHALHRMVEKGVTPEQVLRTLECGYVVEVHNNIADDIRCVFRRNSGWNSICVCVSLTKKYVVTVWKNKVDDNHSTLNPRKYQWKADLLTLCL